MKFVSILYLCAFFCFPNGTLCMEAQKKEAHEECTICFEKLYMSGHDVVVLACNKNSPQHAYHFRCLVTWRKEFYRSKPTCPTCRDDLSSAEHHEQRVFALIEQLEKGDSHAPGEDTPSFKDLLRHFMTELFCCRRMCH